MNATIGFGWAQRRAELSASVEEILASANNGTLTRNEETRSVDFKEEAGRRIGKQREFIPGGPTNPEAATKLADEVACMANTPGGGALIVGVEDRSGRLLGTQLDSEWLREQINNKVGVAPDIHEREIDGLRVLVIYVAQAIEPVPNTGNQFRWRVNDKCVPVDRSEWWQHREASREVDIMAQPSGLRPASIRQAAMDIVRQWYGPEAQSLTDEELLRTTGALRSDGQLTTAAALLLCSMGRVAVDFCALDVAGGNVIDVFEPPAETSLAEQMHSVFSALQHVNTLVTIEKGPAHHPVRRIPEDAVREAVINGLAHRDWERHEATSVRWIRFDSQLEVTSPGGFVGGVDADNVLSMRAPRYPALADLLRAIKLVDKQGLGIDRMYRSMIFMGHRPPNIELLPGQSIHVTLRGGQPHTPVLELKDAIRPIELQRDNRLAIILYELLHRPFISLESLARALQSTKESARNAIDVANQTAIGGQPVLRPFRDVWLLGDAAFQIVQGNMQPQDPRPLLEYATTNEDQARATIDAWLEIYPAITTGELMTLARISRGTAKKLLDFHVDLGHLKAVGQGRGARYVRDAAMQ
ncbi:DUF5635 domain-containing protein [Corynebacterium lizhenjunii]|uniref:DUF5635 domain-containing protein n=1 Tax=Corynebacterium lizhenjunii TaxID=2709394 RepID=UPI0013EA0A50|nr:DUF5635 domain-containing protein [Corynebacterium lizhenjunii]